MTVQELFEKSGGALTWEQFQTAAQESGAKFIDLSEGNYVSKNKYTSDLNAKSNEITTLNNTISARDTDLENLRTRLTEAGADATKLGEVSASLEALQTKYDTDMQAYKEQIAKQAYEFAVKEFANTKNFSSHAARRDFVQSMIAKNLQMENDKIIGAEDFVESYTKDNADAFVAERTSSDEPKVPKFVNPTPGATDVGANQSNAFLNAFHFTGVRPIEQK